MTSQRIRYTAAYLAAILISIGTLKIFYFTIIRSALTPGILDFYIFINHANLFINQGIIYLRDLSLYGPGAPIYKFPPLYGAILTKALSSGIQEEMLYFYAWILQIICYLGGILFCLYTKTTNVPSKNAPLMVACVFFFSLCNNFILENTVRLQIEPYIFLLLSVSVFLLARKKSSASGFFIGIAAMLKIYPALLMLYALFSRHQSKPIIAGFIASCVGVSLVSIWLLNIDENMYFFRNVLPILLAEDINTSMENISIGRILMPVFQSTNIPKMINHIAFIAAMALWCLSMIRRRQAEKTSNQNNTTAIDYAALFMILLIAMPNFWWNYQILNLLPAIIAIKLIATEPRKYFLPIIALVISFILQNIVTIFPLLWSLFDEMLMLLGSEFYVALRGTIQIFLFIAVIMLQWRVHSKNNTHFSVAQ